MSTVEAIASPAVPPSRTGTRSRMFSWALAAGLTWVPTGRACRGIPTLPLDGLRREPSGQLELGDLAVVVGAEGPHARRHELLRAQGVTGVAERLVGVVDRDLRQVDAAALHGPARGRARLDVVVDRSPGDGGAELLGGEHERRLLRRDARARTGHSRGEVGQRRVRASAGRERSDGQQPGHGGRQSGAAAADGIRKGTHRYPERVSDPERPLDASVTRLAATAPLARGAVAA